MTLTIQTKSRMLPLVVLTNVQWELKGGWLKVYHPDGRSEVFSRNFVEKFSVEVDR